MILALPRLELAAGAIDGHNTTFFTPTVPYGVDSVRVYLNGQLRPTDNIMEIDTASGEFQIIEPDATPRPGDIVQVFYLDTRPNSMIALVGQTCRLHGRLHATTQLAGRITTPLLAARLRETTIARGALHAAAHQRAAIVTTDTLRARIKVCSPC